MPPRPLDRPPVAPSSLNHRRRPTNSTTTGILPFQPVAEPSLPVGNNEHASTSARSGDHQRRGSQSIDLAMTAGWWQRFCPCGASPSAVASGCVPGHDAMIYQVLNSSCIPKLLISEVCHGGIRRDEEGGHH